jgi:LAGLIDADG endonuclease
LKPGWINLAMGVNPVYQNFVVLTMHGFSNANDFLAIAFISVVLSMSFWWRDVISEGIVWLKGTILSIYNLNIAKAIPTEDVEKALNIYKANINSKLLVLWLRQGKQKIFGYYLAGLLEGDGHISIPALGNTSLNRVLNPRIVFTSHINNLGLYAFIQSELGNVGRFQTSGKNVVRYIIGDKKGIMLFIELIHGKLRTPKNKRFNDLIKFFNIKYSLGISESLLDNSNFTNNSWLTGFTEADGHFGIKYVESKAKSDTYFVSKRSVLACAENISLKFRLDQRLYDKPTSSSMRPFMESLALFLSCNLKSYTNNVGSEVLSVSVSSIDSINFLVDYFNKYPLLGDKLNDFKKWEIVHNMFISKEHLTDEGRLKIKSLIGKL